MDREIKLSVILAVYNKQNSILPVFETLTSIIANQLSVKQYEIILVDDASTDNSQEILWQLAFHPEVVVESHAKNLGQLKTLETGLRKARGKIIVMTSCDLQNPIRKTVELYQAVYDGYDCAIAYRTERLEKGINSFLSSVFLRMLSVLFPKFPKGGFDFVAFNLRVREKLLENDFDKIFLQLEFLKVAKNIYQIPVVRDIDKLDSSEWNIWRRISYALKAMGYLLKK